MPEFYENGACKYQLAAQPYLAAIALGMRDDSACLAFLLDGTTFSSTYLGARPLWLEQWKARDPENKMVCPFWSNYWYEPCRSCDCRIDNSVSMEIDAMFFVRNSSGQTLAIHIEMKRDREPLSHGQAEAYRPRPACFRDRRRFRKAVLAHDHFLTVMFCGNSTDVHAAQQHFDRSFCMTKHE
jgi:hypothetical protein